MPVLENRIQLGDLTHDIDWQKASRSIRALRGRVVVEMLPVPEKVGLIHLPDSNANIRPDVGVVLANSLKALNPYDRKTMSQYHPYCTAKGVVVLPPLVGALVAVRPYDGTWLEGADCGEYTPKGQIRVYGTFSQYAEPQRCDWWDSIICEIQADMTLKPYGDKIIFKLDPILSTEGGIILADQSKYRTGMATVQAVGPLVFDVRPGDRVCLNLEHLTQQGLTIDGAEDGLVGGTELVIEYVLQAA